MSGIEMRIKVLVKLKAATRIVQFIIGPKRKRPDNYAAFKNNIFHKETIRKYNLQIAIIRAVASSKKYFEII